MIENEKSFCGGGKGLQGLMLSVLQQGEGDQGKQTIQLRLKWI